MAGSDAAKVRTLDGVVIGAGLLAYASSFLPWYSESVSVLGNTRWVRRDDAWQAGFGAWFSVLLLVVAGGVVLVSMLGGRLRLSTSRPLITLGLSVLALVTVLLRWATFPTATRGLGEVDHVDLGDLFTASSGVGFGLYLGLIAAVAAVVASFLALRSAAR
jgi:hypothetical protein